jgi:hypothetical protein
MPGPADSPVDTSQLLDRFPEDAALLIRLLGEDEVFRSVCENYTLARVTLARLKGTHRTREPPELAEYRRLAAELEREIAGALRNAKQPR